MLNNIIVIAVSGKKGSGKDLFYTFAKARVGAKRVAFADYLKHLARQLFKLSVEQTDGKQKEEPTEYVRDGKALTPREILIDLGRWFRSVDPGFWYKKAFEIINGMNHGTIVVVTDMRFKNEADYIKEQGGYLVRLERTQEKRNEVYPGNKFAEDASEVDLDDYKRFDFTIEAKDNNNPQQLKQQVEKILDGILAKTVSKR